MELDLTKLSQQINIAEMLLALGVSTEQAIAGFFQSQGHDDDALAAIMAEAKARLAARGGQ